MNKSSSGMEQPETQPWARTDGFMEDFLAALQHTSGKWAMDNNLL